MRFLYHALIAIIIFGTGIALTLASNDPTDESHYFFLAGALGAEVWLAVAAINLRAKGLPRFDMIVASESIIALGIFALIWGIVIAATFTLERVDLTRGLSLQVLQPLLTPFAEGLIAAGFAPLLSTMLRHIEVLRYGGETEEETTPQAALEAELQNLRNEVRAATQSLNELVAASERSQTSFERSATSLGRSTDSYEAGVARVQATLDNLGDVVKTAGRDFETRLDAVNARLAAHEKQLSDSAQEMDALAESTRRFRAGAEEGATLLNGLRALIESVERFIRPNR